MNPPGVSLDICQLTTKRTPRSKLFSERILICDKQPGWVLVGVVNEKPRGHYSIPHIAYVMGGRVGIDDTHCVRVET